MLLLTKIMVTIFVVRCTVLEIFDRTYLLLSSFRLKVYIRGIPLKIFQQEINFCSKLHYEPTFLFDYWSNYESKLKTRKKIFLLDFLFVLHPFTASPTESPNLNNDSETSSQRKYH